MSSETYVARLPKCNFCPADAHYDGQTRMGRWANMCDDHFNAHGVGLGTGRGQMLMVGDAPARDRAAEAHAAWRAGDWEAFEDAVGDGDPADYLM